jgi:hypothetical protein
MTKKNSKSRLTQALRTVVAAALVATALAAPAFAQEDRSGDQGQLTESARTDAGDTAPADERAGRGLERIKAAADAAVQRRLDTLDRLNERVEASVHMTQPHKDQLLAEYRRLTDGLDALNAEIQATEDAATALRLTADIAADFRIYLVVVPKSWAVAGSDAMVDATERIEEAGARIQEAIDEANEAGIDTTKAQSLLDGALSDGAEAGSVAGPVAAAVIDLDASDWPEPARATLQGAHEDLRAARELIRSAADGLRSAADALRASLGR